ncbi:hypothetical protein [Faecalibaculum rodentium]|nr:hypothetical protein [Faecalibaculum rodentium]
MIKGIAVTLYNKVQTGTDDFGQPIWDEIPEVVEDILVAPSTPDDIVTSTDLAGKKAVYTMAIPKDDTHVWENRKIEFLGQTFHSFGFSILGIKANIPLRWNRKVMVERYG